MIELNLLRDINLESISKMSFGPISLLVPRFQRGEDRILNQNLIFEMTSMYRYTFLQFFHIIFI